MIFKNYGEQRSIMSILSIARMKLCLIFQLCCSYKSKPPQISISFNDLFGNMIYLFGFGLMLC